MITLGIRCFVFKCFYYFCVPNFQLMLKAIIFLLLISNVLIMKAQTPFVVQTTPAEFDSLIKKNDGILLDVRTINEFNNGHIEGATQLNFYAPYFAERLLQLPKEKPIYIYCNVGFRSNRAAGFLAHNNYEKVYNLQHGIMLWHRQGFPIYVSPDAQPDLTDRLSPEEWDLLLKTESLLFVDFYAPWCAPCRQMMPMIDQLKKNYKGRVTIIKVNADVSRELMAQLEINAIPYFKMYVNGKAVFNHTGLIKKEEIENLFLKYLN